VYPSRYLRTADLGASSQHRLDTCIPCYQLDVLYHNDTQSSSGNLCCAAMDPDMPVANEPAPSVFRWILGFLMVGACWGLTTPFMRKAAMYVDSLPR
jgi:hypothetical protein